MQGIEASEQCSMKYHEMDAFVILRQQNTHTFTHAGKVLGSSRVTSVDVHKENVMTSKLDGMAHPPCGTSS